MILRFLLVVFYLCSNNKCSNGNPLFNQWDIWNTLKNEFTNMISWRSDLPIEKKSEEYVNDESGYEKLNYPDIIVDSSNNLESEGKEKFLSVEKFLKIYNTKDASEDRKLKILNILKKIKKAFNLDKIWTKIYFEGKSLLIKLGALNSEERTKNYGIVQSAIDTLIEIFQAIKRFVLFLFGIGNGIKDETVIQRKSITLSKNEGSATVDNPSQIKDPKIHNMPTMKSEKEENMISNFPHQEPKIHNIPSMKPVQEEEMILDHLQQSQMRPEPSAPPYWELNLTNSENIKARYGINTIDDLERVLTMLKKRGPVKILPRPEEPSLDIEKIEKQIEQFKANERKLEYEKMTETETNNL